VRPKFDLNSLNAFDATVASAMTKLNNSEVAEVLKLAVVPVERMMRQLTLVHKSSAYRTFSKFNPKYSGKKTASRYNTNRLYESIRIRNVSNSKVGARVIVGASKKTHQAGWRAHFIDRGFTSKKGKFIEGKHFSNKAFETTKDQVNSLFGAGMSIKFKRVFGQ